MKFTLFGLWEIGDSAPAYTLFLPLSAPSVSLISGSASVSISPAHFSHIPNPTTLFF